MKKIITISSGKGGTGKTFVSVHLSLALNELGENVRYIDCDVEEPNGHLFLKPQNIQEEVLTLLSPSSVDSVKCIGCKKCVESCRYNAITAIKNKILIFKNLCHVCGVCTMVCPVNAIQENPRNIGLVKQGITGSIPIHYGLLETGEGGMTPRVIKKVKENIQEGYNILDSPPGTSCPVVETVKNSDLTVLVTDPTPFGINDLKLSVEMCRKIGQKPVIVINRADDDKEALEAYCKRENLSIIGEIPDDRRIAERYSEGELVYHDFPEYREVFLEIARKMITLASDSSRKIASVFNHDYTDRAIEIPDCQISQRDKPDTKEIVIISGKGGTGKTSLTASFCAIEKELFIADSDVDAADLHLITNPEIMETGKFSGGSAARIDKELCDNCGKCEPVCRFDAVFEREGKRGIDELSCEGCGACSLVCPQHAISMHPVLNGDWYVSKTRFGLMSHAKLLPGSENSGKLVALVRDKKKSFQHNAAISIIDGSPGTGCPVISSITGTDYVVVVTEPTVSGVHDFKRILDLIHFFHLKSGVIVNKADINPEKTQEIQQWAEKTGCDFLGAIQYDTGFTLAQKKGLTFIEYKSNETSGQIRDIWAKIKDVVNYSAE